MSNKLTSGFTIIEILLVIVISALLSNLLYIAFDQARKSVVKIDNIIDSDEALLLFYNQLDKDISAAFVPQALLDQNKPDQNKDEKKKNILQNKTQLAPIDQNIDKNKEQDKNKIEKIFFSQSNNENLSFLTFVTTNSLSNYNNPSAHIVRIVYKLEPVAGEDNNYKLLRQELSDIIFKNLSDNKNNNNKFLRRSYELISNIKSLKVSFIAPELKEKNKDLENKRSEDKKFITVNSWSSDDQFKKYGIYMPNYVRFEGEFWNTKKTKSISFVFDFKILASIISDAPEKKVEQDVSREKDKNIKYTMRYVPKGGSSAAPDLPSPTVNIITTPDITVRVDKIGGQVRVS